jgi:hypothetical protein
MDQVAAILPPMTILDCYERSGAGTRKATLDARWAEFGDSTAEVMAEGVRVLAMLWQSAWAAGGSDSVAPSRLKALRPEDVRARYIDRSFVPSSILNEIGAVLR